MKHFATDNEMNMFRLPVSWQFLVNNDLTGPLHSPSLEQYDQLVQSCLATGAHCIISIHNFARWNGAVIGQSPAPGPADEDFVRLWTGLAKEYATSPKIVFELMNEPHDLDITLWAATCQKAVTAIRDAGAMSQMVLLPGTAFSSAAELKASGSGDALAKITNPDGTTTNLLFALHKYLDKDNSGTHAECTTNNNLAFSTAAEYLRGIKRQAIVSETGAAPTDHFCMVWFCEQNRFINENADVFLGLVAWGAGSFGADYMLSQTPRLEGGRWVDTPLLANCVVGTWIASNTTGPEGPNGIGAVMAGVGRLRVPGWFLAGALGIPMLFW